MSKYTQAQLFTALFLGSALVACLSGSVWFLAFIWPGCMIYFGLFWIFFPHLLK